MCSVYSKWHKKKEIKKEKKKKDKEPLPPTKSQTSEMNIHLRTQWWRLLVAKFSQFLKWESSKVLLQIQKLKKNQREQL